MSTRRPLAEFIRSLADARIHVVGLAGTECAAFLNVLDTHGITRSVVVHDLAVDLEAAWKTFATTHVALKREARRSLFDRLVANFPEIRLGSDYLDGIEDSDLVFVAQSWDLYEANAPIAELLEEDPARACTLMDLYLRHLPCRVVGVTGTNGKTTVASMIAGILDAAGAEVAIGGNHRYHPQLLPELDALPSEAIAVLEISHKHLNRLENGPEIALVTNIAGDHLDQFESFSEYAAIKARLVEKQHASDTAILLVDDPELQQLARRAPSRVIPVTADATDPNRGAWITADQIHARDPGGEVHAFDRSLLRVPGTHNALNATLAISAALQLNVSPDAIREGISGFRGVKHRLESLRSIGGVRIYDDTAATSPAATHAAVRALQEEGAPLVLIVGGDAKGNDYSALGQLLGKAALPWVALPGDAAAALTAAGGGSPVSEATTLEEAMTHGLEHLNGEGALLISPAGAGFHTQHAGLRSLVRMWGRTPRA